MNKKLRLLAFITQIEKINKEKNFMMWLSKKISFSFCIVLLLLLSNKSFSQALTGTLYITSYNSHTANYNTIAAAIADLNAKGVGAGGVTFMIPPGYTETFTNGAVATGAGVPTGYTIAGGGMVITTITGTFANTIVFEKDTYIGGADPLITAGAGVGAADAILTITGGHYITIQSIDLVDPTSNASANADMEYGFYIKNSSAGNGSTYDTIRNSKITLQRINPNTSAYGIYQNVAAAPVNAAGANSYNAYINDTVTNVYNGIYLLGGVSPNPDLNCTISGCAVGSTTSNDIGSSSNSAVNFGIQVTNQSGVTIHNTEVKNVSNTSGSSPYGIEVTTPLGTSSVYACKVHEITDLKASTSCAVYGIYINVASGNTVNVYNNFIYDVLYGHGVSTSTKNQFLLSLNGTGNVNVYFNSILSNNPTVDVWNACLYINGVTANVVDNIFKDTVICTSNADSYCIYVASGTLSTTSNYNNYDIQDYGSGRNFVGYNGSGRLTLANWLASVTSPTDANSSDFRTNFTNMVIGAVDLHLKIFVPTPAYTGITISTPSITTDIDGDTRVYPMIGADEVNFTTPTVIVGGSIQPSDSSVSRGSSDNVLYGITFTVDNANTVFSGITVNTNTSANNNYQTSSANDFGNLQFWIDSVNSSFNPATALQLGSTVANAPGYGGSVVFSPTRTLLSGTTYYLFITDAVGATGTQGDNINLVATSLSNIIFSSGTTVTGATGAGGKQTIVQDWYNWGNTFGAGDPTQDASSLLGWYDSTTHASNPSDFVTNNQRFNVIRLNSTMLHSLTLGQTGTTNLHFVVGSGTAALGFWATQPITTVGAAVVDVEALDTLRLLTSSTPTAIGTLFSGSTVEYGDTAVATTQTIIPANYYNLKFSNLSGGGTRSFPSWTGVAGAFTPGNFTSSSAGVISFNGTTAQAIPAFTYNSLTIKNSGATATTILSGTAKVNTLLTDSTAFAVPTGDTLALGTSATVATLLGTTTINGTLVNNDPLITTFASTSTSTLLFGLNSNYNLSATLTTASNSSGQIPAATWAASSTINVTGITTATAVITVGAPTGAGFGNFSFDDSAMTANNTSYKLFGGFTSPVTFQGTLTLGRNNFTSAVGLQMTTGAMTINAANVIVNAGNYGLMNYGNTASLNVSGNFTINGTSPYVTSAGYSSPDFIIATNNSAANGTLNVTGNFSMTGTSTCLIAGHATASGILNVGGNFSMAGSSTLSQTAGTAALNFTGTSAQNATFTTVSAVSPGPLNMSVTTSSDVVTLLSNLNLPGSSSALSLTGKLAINGNTLTLNGTYVSGGASGSLTGSATSNLVIGSTATSMPLTFTPDAAKVNNSLLTLTVNANASLATSKLYIVGNSSASPFFGSLLVSGSAVFTTHDSLTLQSNASGTAQVAANTSGSTGYVSGGVTIERYFPSHRSWRLVTAPVSSTGTPSAPTINASWQEGFTNASRLVPQYSHTADSIYGTIITDGTVSANGYDQGSTINPSIAYYNSGTSTWGVPTATNSGHITDQPGYMLFVRGYRDYIVSSQYTPPTSTTLRVHGALNQGTQAISGTGYQVIGNPYASSFYYDGVISRGSNTPSYFYIWDPLMTGTNSVGSFILLSKVGTHLYTAIPNPQTASPLNTSPHLVDTTGIIQSGQAVITYFNNGTAPASGTSSIQESDKVNSSDDLIFRPEVPATPLGDSTEQFRTNLFAANSDGTISLEDGVLNLYNDGYTDTVNFLQDAPKFSNIVETIALQRDSYKLSLETRRIIGATDTVFLSMSGMQQKAYTFEFTSTGLNHPGLSGFLVDSFLHTLTPLNLNGITDVNFTVTSNAASSATHRFEVIFIPIGGDSPLPVTFTSVKAAEQADKSIAVQWDVTNQLNIKAYEVEKSTDGVNFTIANTTAAIGNNVSSISYSWVDGNPVTGDNYYRIVSVGNDGTLSYSHIVDVKIGTGSPAIAVYPNPVSDGVVNIQLTNMVAGNYNIHVLNTIGQEIATKQITHAGGSSTQQVLLSKALAKGMYQLEIVKPDNNKASFNVLVQ